MDKLFEYKMGGGLFELIIYENRISILDRRGGIGTLVNPQKTDIILKNITGVIVKGLLRKITLTMNDGTTRELPYPLGKDAEKVCEILTGLI